MIGRSRSIAGSVVLLSGAPRTESQHDDRDDDWRAEQEQLVGYAQLAVKGWGGED